MSPSATKICPQCGTEFPDDQRFCPKDGSTLKSQSGTGDLVGSVIADRYHVTKKLGEGGMGQVYLAEHVRMGRKSAVKVMHQGMVHDADAISRFNREAANASRISHPNVAAIYDFGETPEGLIYLAMEFVEGEPLTAIIERQGALPAARAASIVEQTAGALAAAHELGIVHRDLKPDNIMIARNRDGSDCVKVVDFGIAKAADVEAQKVTRTGLIVGTPEYMSPEQLAGDPLDGRSDVYALALVAFAMLTGRLPFPSETAQESMISRLTERPRSLAEMRPEVSWPAQLQAVMDRALSRDAAGRYASAADFGRDFARAIEKMPQTVATEAGTSIMATPSLPATRVASAPTRIAATAAVPAPRRSRLPMVVGGTAVVVAGIVAIALLKGSGLRGQGSAGSPVAGGRLPVTSTAVTSTALTSPDPTTSTAALPNVAERRDSTPAAPAASAPEPTARQTLRDIAEVRRLASSSAPADNRRAIARADALAPRLALWRARAEVLYWKAQAQTSLNDEAGTCATLRTIQAGGTAGLPEYITNALTACP